MKRNKDALMEERKMVIEMIDASRELSEHLGKHPHKIGCNCIACVTKRKRLTEEPNDEWKFKL